MLHSTRHTHTPILFLLSLFLSPLLSITSHTGAAPPYGFPLFFFLENRGDCATCQINLAGRMERACTGKVPPEPKLKSLQEKGLAIRV
jgi:hypothetical protein